MLTVVHLFESLDESNAPTPRSQLALDLGIPVSTLGATRVALPNSYIDVGRDDYIDNSTPPPGRPEQSQYLVGKHLEVVITVKYPDFGEGPFEISELEGCWQSVAHCVPSRRRAGSLPFDEGAALHDVLGPNELGAEVVRRIEALSSSRRKRYQRCKFCNDLTPPEHLFGSYVCMGCATEQFGVVY